MRAALFTFFCLMATTLLHAQVVPNLKLDGEWEMGLNRTYTTKVKVPGIHHPPGEITGGVTWYKKVVTLPAGKYAGLAITLRGARFSPALYINGKFVDSSQGGMAPVTFSLLNRKDIKAGKPLTIEIALKPLSQVASTDASLIPEADRWRSNISSSLWDGAFIRFIPNNYISEVIPTSDVLRKQLTVRVSLASAGGKPLPPNSQVRAELINSKGESVVESYGIAIGKSVPITMGTRNLKLWSPDEPEVYTLVVDVLDDKNKLVDRVAQPFGLREFRTLKKGFVLNNRPITLRGGSIVWHRWVRDPESTTLAYDTTWFINNVVKPMKERGANYLRFHLGAPPEAFLHICDRMGLLVQYEWPAFKTVHGSATSLEIQWTNWLDLAMRHPSVVIIHPWNEVHDEAALTLGRSVIAKLIPKYPNLVVAERNTLHLHKYWWSLFENVGLYYNDFEELPQATMVDEFGGMYLDGEGNLGGYTTLKDAYARFLGANHTKEQRLEHHAMANGKMAEYWRRVGVAGVAPFCIASSPEDGNHWYLGPIKDGNLKPVWNALTPAWAPVTVSIECWDRNAWPGQRFKFPLYLINGQTQQLQATARVTMTDEAGTKAYDTTITANLDYFTRNRTHPLIYMPEKPGTYTIKAELLEPKQAAIKHPIISEWKMELTKPTPAAALKGMTVGIDPQESELILYAERHDWKVVGLNDASAKVLLLSRRSYDKLLAKDATIKSSIESALNAGRHVLMLNAGPMWLGDADGVKTGPTDVPHVKNPRIEQVALLTGLNMTFTEVAEPESHIHATEDQSKLWNNLKPQQTWLWNGYRGGIIVPAADMSLETSSQKRELVRCGMGLKRVPVVSLSYGNKGGRLLFSQLIMQNRLVPEYSDLKRYGHHYDPAADQFLLNMIAETLSPSGKGE